MIRIRLFLKFIFFFFGTFLHELSHYLFALMLGRAEGFSVLPRIEGESFIFGSVKSRTRYKVLSSFVASAPLIWWAVLILLMIHLGFIRTGSGMPEVNAAAVLRRLRSFSLRDLLFIWLFLQLLWAGRLSGPDIKNFSRGLLSVSGLVFLAAAVAVVYFSRRFL